MADRVISDVLTKPDAALEMTLRPSLFADFIKKTRRHITAQQNTEDVCGWLERMSFFRPVNCQRKMSLFRGLCAHHHLLR